MLTYRRTTLLVGLLALAGATSSCSDSLGSSRARLSILLTDAPGDVKSAVVTIDQIYLQGSADEGGSRIVLRDDDVTTDLVTLANSTAELVKDALVPAGRYHQLRFVISGGYVEVENADGSSSFYASSADYAGLPAGTQVAGALQMPSYAQTGIKVNLPQGGVVVEGEQNVVLVDFDVSRSFGRQAGSSSRWVMTPVLQATEFTTSSGVLVTLSPASGLTMPQVSGQPLSLSTFSAVLSNSSGSEEVLPLTDGNGDGTFEAQFRFLLPGEYSLDFRTSAAGVTFTTDPTRPKAITVGSGASTSHAFTLTSASN